MRYDDSYIPPEAEARLRATASGELPFAAGLTVNGLSLAATSGLTPLGEVMGAAVRTNFAGGALGYVKPGAVREFSFFRLSWDTVVREALGRLRREAEAVGANLVVGVSLRRRKRDLPDVAAIEFTLTGTAMHDPRAERTPVLSSLSAAEHWQLALTGAKVVGLAVSSKAFVGRTTRPTRRAVRRRPLLGHRTSPFRSAAPVALDDLPRRPPPVGDSSSRRCAVSTGRAVPRASLAWRSTCASPSPSRTDSRPCTTGSSSTGSPRP